MRWATLWNIWGARNFWGVCQCVGQHDVNGECEGQGADDCGGARPPRLGGLSYTSPSWTGPSCTPKSLLHAYRPVHSYETPRRVVLIVCHGPPGDGRDRARRGVVLGSLIPALCGKARVELNQITS